MNVIVALVLGILIGWLIEWVIDWLYWRRAGEQSERPSAAIPVLTKRTSRRNAPPPANPDDLTVIKGVGPVIAQQLNNEGIYTYEQLAELTEDEFEDALGDLLERFFNERTILRHARELAAKRKAGSK
jgi:predicted flap endonuclease-1-like 5' DNA nuclease